MIKKIGAFLEEHVEKIILIVVGLLCSWLLVTRVLLSPNVVTYDKITLGPSAVDLKILEDVEKLRTQNNPPEIILDINMPHAENFVKLFASPLSDIRVDLMPFMPGKGKIVGPKEYEEPDIEKVKVTGVEIEHFRSVVYEPTDEVTRERLYADSKSEPNDLDFVTVAAKIDIAAIVDEYDRCYNRNVSQALADPCKAKPIIASVNLQRQELKADGSWGDWVNVPRARIDSNRNIFKVVEKVSDLPIGGMQVFKFQLNNIIAQLELLQPEPYQFATANDEWLTPSLHRDFLAAQKKDEQEAKKAERAEEDNTVDDGTGRRGRDRTTAGGIGSAMTGTSTTTQSRRSGGSRRGTTDAATTTTTTPSGRRRSGSTPQSDSARTVADVTGQTELWVNEVYDDFEAIILKPENDFLKMDEPLVFWAHDDTVEPEKTYRYRIRLGTLNPVAEADSDTVVFWSQFSEVTSSVDIPGKIYFFPGAVQDAAKTVNISVYKLALGNWYKEEFERVAQGEIIGDIVKVETKKTDSTTIVSDVKEPETIDYTTGAVMVDVARVFGWVGTRSLNVTPYYDMMYSYDGREIRHMPATTSPNLNIWPTEMYKAYNYVLGLVNKKREPFRAFGSSEIQIQQMRSGQYRGRITRP